MPTPLFFGVPQGYVLASLFPSTPALFQPSLRDMESVLSCFLTTPRRTFISTWIRIASLWRSVYFLTALLTLKIGLSTTVCGAEHGKKPHTLRFPSTSFL